jgi:hypothetical protein
MSVNPARQEVFQLAINRENVDWKYRIRIGWNSLARDADLKEAAGVCGGRGHSMEPEISSKSHQ